MKNILTDCEKIDWKRLMKLRDIIIAKIMKTVPDDANIDIDDVTSQVDSDLAYLIKKWNPETGGSSLNTYCYAYWEKLSRKHVFKDYRAAKNFDTLDGIDDDDEELSETQKAKTVKAYAESKKPSFDRHEYFEKMTAAYEAAISLDNKTEGYYRFADILDLMKMNISQREIAEEFGCSQTEISKRLAKIRKETERMETDI